MPKKLKIKFFLNNFEKNQFFQVFEKKNFRVNFFKKKISQKTFIWPSKKKILVKKFFSIFSRKKINSNFFSNFRKKNFKISFLYGKLMTIEEKIKIFLKNSFFEKIYVFVVNVDQAHFELLPTPEL